MNPRKGPKWSVTPGVFVLLAVLLSGMPTARAPFEDVPPTTQEVVVGYANGTFPDNISTSDDTRISLQTINTSTETNPGSNIWEWAFKAYYNWSAVDMIGDRWQLLVECQITGPPPAWDYGVFFVTVITPPDILNVRVACPESNVAGQDFFDTDEYATCLYFCYEPPLSPYDDYNLSTNELNNGSVSVFIQVFALDNCSIPGCYIVPGGEPWEYAWLIDHISIRRVYTVAPPPPPPSPILDWMLILILLILWVSFSAIGIAKPSGLLFMGGALCGIVLAFFFVLPVAELPGIAVLGLAMTCMLGGAAIAISSGGEAG